MIIILVILILMTSCSMSIPKTITVNLKDNHTWEEVQGRSMYYTLKYFDGDEVKTLNLDADVKTVNITIKDGGLRPIIAIPIGRLAPLGGFYMPLSGSEVNLYREKGTFAAMLINAVSFMPQAVSDLNYDKIERMGIDLEIINQELFLEELFAEKLSEKSFKNTKIYTITLDSLLSGYWYRDNPRSDDLFIKNNGDSVTMKLFPGSYYWANFDRGIFFSLLITEKGEAYSSLVKIPKWY